MNFCVNSICINLLTLRVNALFKTGNAPQCRQLLTPELSVGSAVVGGGAAHGNGSFTKLLIGAEWDGLF